jgi:hypothetical protein
MAETLDYIQMLQEAIRRGYECEPRHVESVPIHEVFRGKTVWDGTVEVFDLAGHAEAKRAYAWGHAMRDTGNEVRIVTILGVPPVDSPRKAVQVSIVADAKQNRHKRGGRQ